MRAGLDRRGGGACARESGYHLAMTGHGAGEFGPLAALFIGAGMGA